MVWPPLSIMSVNVGGGVVAVARGVVSVFLVRFAGRFRFFSVLNSVEVTCMGCGGCSGG